MTGKTTFLHHWYTVQVTALPVGWRNVYQQEDDSLLITQCPALLLQEHRATEIGPPYKTTLQEPPYSTRAVFADHDGSELEPANEAANYITTIGPGEPIPDVVVPGSQVSPTTTPTRAMAENGR